MKNDWHYSKIHLILLIFLCFICIPIKAYSTNNGNTASDLDYSLFTMGEENVPTMLIIGGIQGDEPGGFSAATLIATRYEVTSGALFVVPNLNFPSIVRSSRGIHGDMNRKFSTLDSNDPQYETVMEIRKLILSPEVSLVLNLHDGSGFYRKEYTDDMHGPHRWGQCVIIDQSLMPTIDLPLLLEEENAELQEKLLNIEALGLGVVAEINDNLLDSEHYFELYNTHTAEGDVEMEKSLSWFAVRNGKPAFGLEASKQFPVVERTYYHLHMIEAFAKSMGIELERDFPLTLDGVREALYSNLSVSFLDGRIVLPLDDVRPRINYLPISEDDLIANTSKPILVVLPDDENLSVHYGNRTLTNLYPDWHEIDYSLNGLNVNVDGIEREIAFGEIVQISTSFQTLAPDGYRINAIGADTGQRNESHLILEKDDFIQRFSVDNNATIFRVEAYRDTKFCGMFLVQFVE